MQDKFKRASHAINEIQGYFREKHANVPPPPGTQQKQTENRASSVAPDKSQKKKEDSVRSAGGKINIPRAVKGINRTSGESLYELLLYL